MRKHLLIALAATLLLNGCDHLFHAKPPARILAGCPALTLMNLYPLGPVTFGAMLERFRQGGLDLAWEPGSGDTGVLRGTRVDPLTRATNHIALQVSAVPATNPQCPNGATLVTDIVVNDERLDTREMLSLLSGIVGALVNEQHADEQATPAQPRPVPSPLDSGSNAAAPVAAPAAPPATSSLVPASFTPLELGAAARAASRGVVVSDDGTWCCLTVGQIARYFMTDGGTAAFGAGDNGALILSITDPRGRWNGWHAFQLALTPQDDKPDALFRPATLTVDGRRVLTDEPSADDRISPLLRSTFKLTKPASPTVDLGPAYQQCSTTGAAGQGSDSAERECLDAEYARRDLALNQAYRAKMAELAPARQAALRTDERAWLRQRDQRCAAPSDGGTLDLVQADYCQVALTVQRTAAILGFR